MSGVGGRSRQAGRRNLLEVHNVAPQLFLCVGPLRDRRAGRASLLPVEQARMQSQGHCAGSKQGGCKPYPSALGDAGPGWKGACANGTTAVRSCDTTTEPISFYFKITTRGVHAPPAVRQPAIDAAVQRAVSPVRYGKRLWALRAGERGGSRKLFRHRGAHQQITTTPEGSAGLLT